MILATDSTSFKRSIKLSKIILIMEIIKEHFSISESLSQFKLSKVISKLVEFDDVAKDNQMLDDLTVNNLIQS